MRPSALIHRVIHRLRERLWHQWFPSLAQDAHSGPTPNCDAAAPQGQRLGHWLADRLVDGLTALISPLLLAFCWLLSGLTPWVAAARLRRQLAQPPLPGLTVWAVGNWVVGGAGKTPTVLALAERIQAKGGVVGFLGHGHGSRLRHAVVVSPKTRSRPSPDRDLGPEQLGDEACLLIQRGLGPVALGPSRREAALLLRQAHPELTDLILDDGLSQTEIRPDHRVLVLDERGLGNGRCLPAGPLRMPWPPRPEAQPDLLVLRGGASGDGLGLGQPGPERLTLSLTPGDWMPAGEPWGRAQDPSLRPDATPKTPDLQTAQVVALAGIALPARFAQVLKDMGIQPALFLALPDHEPDPARALMQALHQALAHDPKAWSGRPITVLMTEKDAVKWPSTSPVPLAHSSPGLSPGPITAWFLPLQSQLT